MGATYTRQSSSNIVDGNVIEAADLNNEFNQILAAFAVSTGHTHDGTAAEGGPVTKLLGTSITIGDATSGTDITVTFDGETSDGVLYWMEDEDHFKFADDIVVDSTKRLYFNDEGGEYIYGDGTDLYLTSGADINIPADIGMTFGDDGEKIEGDGTDLTISASADLNLTATTDINIPANVGLTFGNDGEKIEGDGTDLTVSANNLTVDAAADIILDADGGDVFFKDGGTTFGSATNTSGNLIIKSGTTTALTFSGANATLAGDLTISGDDLTMGTNTDTAIMVADGTNFNPVVPSGDVGLTNAGVFSIASNVIVNADINSSAGIADSKLATISTADKVAGGAIQIDSGTDGTSITIADTDKFLIDDGGTTKYINASQINAYTSSAIAADDIGTGDAAVTIATSSGDITIDAQAGHADIIFKGTDSTSDITALTLDMSEAGAATFNNKIVATELDISGNIDIDGTTNLDAVDIDGAVQLDATLTIGANDQGYDVIFYGDTASANLTWDTSVDDLILNGAARIVIPDGQLVLGSTAVSSTAAELNILDGKSFVDEDNMSSDSATAIASQQSIKAYVDAQKADMSFVLEDGDGTEVTITKDKEVKFVEGGGLDINWTDTDNGTDADPYDLTFTIAAAQTGITSLLATDIKIGEDDQTKIDFETADTIHFYAGNENQLILTDGALTPASNAIVDLGTDALEFKDAYFDGTVETDALSIAGTAITTTAAEINLIDGGTSRGTTAVASGDGILINDGGTMRMTNVDTVSTYFASHSVGGGNIVTTGALDSGSITSGFGTIDTGSSTITTTGLITGGSLDIDNVLINGTTIGHTDDTDLITVADGLVTVAGEISVTTLDIGGTNVSATAAEINYSDLATLGTTAASKVFTADANNLTKITGGVYLEEATLTFDATQDWDVRASPVAKVTLTNNVTFDAPTNPTTGQYISIVCIQDGTGSRTIAWNAVFEFTGDTAPTATTTASKGDMFTFRYNGSKWLEVGRNLNLTLS